MAMTFDEAFEEIEELSFTTDEGESWVNNYSSVYYLIQELKDSYAPTIEMTKSQYNELMKFKQKFGSSHLAAAINQGNNGTWSFLDELSGRIFEHGIGETTDEYIEAIMQAWLHPDTIKVVDNDV